MNRLAQFRAAYRRTTALLAALLLVCVALGAGLTFAQGVGTKKDFDHLKTGFALTGAHVDARCEACHLNGIFKGTPRECATCHVSGMRFARGNVVRPQQHVPSTLGCDACHTTQTYVGAKFNHIGVAAGSCQTCHNGTLSSGKPSTHTPTTASCDACHRTSAWSPAANFDHTGVVPGTCTTCHGAGKATAKSAQHMPTNANQSCDDCHKSFSGWRPTAWNHTQMAVTAQCATCHSGGYPPADGRPSNHIPHASIAAAATANCDTCHKGSITTWANGKFHTNVAVTGGCTTCHTGGFMNAVGKPNTVVHNGVTNCESCHSTGGWAGAKVDHSAYNVSTNCTTCHDGKTATAKPTAHMPVGATGCFNCHSVSPAGWKPTKWNHTQVTVTTVCASCHTGGYPPAGGKPTDHIPYQTVAVSAAANCDACHKGSTTSWANGKFHANYAVTSGCTTCHTGGFMNAAGKPNTVVHNGVTNCESCHSTGGWAGAKVDHSAYNVSTNCTTCHDGKTATAKPTAHMPVGATGCFNCHSVSPAGWKPTKWNHTQVTVTAVCAACHSGGYPPADGKPTNHIPYQTVAVSAAANCDACHKGSTTSWANGKYHTNYAVSTACATCHTGAYQMAMGKPNNATHATVTGNCESCHKSTTTWSGAKVDHAAFNASTNCASCHGVTATGKPATHIPVGATSCFSCHNVSPAGWTPGKWNHTQVTVTAQCSSCHTGGYPPADGKPTDHIPYQTVAVSAAANCDACHKGSTTSWANGKFHSNYVVSTTCATCHTGAYQMAVGKPNNATHAAVTGNCENCHKSTTTWSGAKVDHSGFNASTNCASCHGVTATGKSATHIPVGATNCFSCHNVSPAQWTPTKWNHTQVAVTAVCASCHTGGYPPADGKPTNHIPYQTVAVSAAANCDACHKGSTTSWANGKFHAAYSVSTTCATCHTGAYLMAVGKPNNATHATVTGNCESCHKSTTNWSGAKVDHSMFNVSTNCASCHGVTATGKSATHIPVGATNCFSCHNVSPAQWTPTKWNHTQVTVTAVCASCHTGGYPPADGKPTNHIPYQTVAVSAAANCDGCHKGSTTSWANGKFHANYSVSTTCATCHTGAYLMAVGKPNTATHASVTGNCESCHKSTTNWTTVTYTHSPANAVGTGTCDTCHNGTTAKGKAATHIPIPSGTAKCDSCHKSQASFATSVTMNHTVVTTAQCKSCHNGSYVSQGPQGALAKPTNHIPEVQLLNGATMDCNACHKSTTTWTTMTMNHNASLGNGAGWCKACHQSGTSYLGSMEKKSLTHQKSTGVTDCSQSGCHRPLGTKGNPYTKWD